jgi:formylglycine-generating enzyme required for sulfatase activity
MRKTKSMEKRDVHDSRTTRPVLHSVMLAMCSIAAWCSLCANPVVSKVTVTPDGGSVFKIGYTLTGGPAIVTVDVLTNGVSTAGIGAKYVSGDVNRIVRDDGNHMFYWQSGSDWPKGVSTASASFAVRAWPLNDPPPYMAANLSVANCLRFYAYPDAFPAPGGVTNILFKTEWLVMRKIPAAGVTWTMGLNDTDSSGNGANRSTSHKVTFQNNYYVAIYELTRRQASYFGGASVSAHDALPMDKLSTGKNPLFADIRGSYAEGYLWPTDKRVKEDSVIGKMRSLTGLALDLTTDAQWEYACRAGTDTAFSNGYNGMDKSGISDIALLDASGPQEVGLLNPNPWGIYDMHGNVWEVCLDWCQTSLSSAETDPVGPTPISYSAGLATIYKNGKEGETEAVGHVFRGGAYNRTDGGMLRSAHRNWWKETATDLAFGYRLACPCPAVSE